MTANDLVNYQRRSKKKLTSEAKNCQIVCLHNSEQSGSFVGVGRSKRCWVKIVDRLSAKKEDKVQFKYRRRVTTHRRSQRSQGSPVAKPEGTKRRPLLRSLKLLTTSAPQSNWKAILHTCMYLLAHLGSWQLALSRVIARQHFTHMYLLAHLYQEMLGSVTS